IIDAGVERVTPHHAHPRLDHVAVAAGEAARVDHRALFWQRQRGGHARGLVRAHTDGRVLEVALAASFDAVSPPSRLGDVEIDFHDPAFAPALLDQQREPGFETLAEVAAALPQEDVLRGLLADRRAAADATSLRVAFDRALDRLAVEAVVAAE